MKRWRQAYDKVARLIAEGKLSPKEIAAEADVSPCSVRRWKNGRKGSKHGTVEFPEFVARVAALREERAEGVKGSAIGQREARIARMNDDWHRLREIRRARSLDPAMKNVPGGTTGLLVMNKKGEIVIDHDLLSALGALEALAAKEGGEPGGRGGSAERETELVVSHEDFCKDAGASPGSEDDTE